MISAYFAAIQATLDYYSLFAFVQDTIVTFDKRPGGQGYIVGQITFRDSSELHFREYVDVTGAAVDKLSYSYHYQSFAKTLLFRYDNARHKPPLSQREHKHHEQGQISLVDAPVLDDVFKEIIALNQWV